MGAEIEECPIQSTRLPSVEQRRRQLFDPFVAPALSAVDSYAKNSLDDADDIYINDRFASSEREHSNRTRGIWTYSGKCEESFSIGCYRPAAHSKCSPQAFKMLRTLSLKSKRAKVSLQPTEPRAAQVSSRRIAVHETSYLVNNRGGPRLLQKYLYDCRHIRVLLMTPPKVPSVAPTPTKEDATRKASRPLLGRADSAGIRVQDTLPTYANVRS